MSAKGPWKIYSDLTKFGIVVFVLISGLAGYVCAFEIENHFDVSHLMKFLMGLYFLSSGSLALNQAQEYKLDQKMNRTKNRPIASGKLKPAAAYILSILFILFGLKYLYGLQMITGHLGLLSVVLYNLVYTKWWKRNWNFAAVPGAIPGALPVTIGYSACNDQIFNSESIYLFLILFLWQMPHFWVLAIKYKDDYRDGGIPVLPVSLGVQTTLFQIGLYTILYVGVAMASPWFINSSWFYLLIVFPMSIKLLWEFWKYFKSGATQNWLRFFIWTNLSVILYLFVPILDKWNFLIFNSN